MTIITTFIAGLIDGGSGIGKYNFSSMAAMVISLIVCVIVRAVCNIGSSKMSYLSSKTVKRNLRQMIYEKLLVWEHHIMRRLRHQNLYRLQLKV